MRTVATEELYKTFDSTNYPVLEKFRNLKFHDLISGLEGNVPTQLLSGFAELKELNNKVIWDQYDLDNKDGYRRGYLELSKKLSRAVKFINTLTIAFHNDKNINYGDAIAINEELKYRFNHARSLGESSLKNSIELMQRPEISTSSEMKNRNLENLFYSLETSVSKLDSKNITACRELYYDMLFFELYFNNTRQSYGMVTLRNSKLDTLIIDLEVLSTDLLNKKDSIEILLSEIPTSEVQTPKKSRHKESLRTIPQVKLKTAQIDTARKDSVRAKTPTTIQEWFIKVFYNTPFRNVILVVLAIALVGFAIWKTLPDSTKEKILSRKSRIKMETEIIYELLQNVQSQKSLTKIKQYEEGSISKSDIQRLVNSLNTLSNLFTGVLIKISPESGSRKNLEQLHGLIVDLNEHLAKGNNERRDAASKNNFSLVWRKYNKSMASEVRNLNNNYAIKFDDFISALENS